MRQKHIFLGIKVFTFEDIRTSKLNSLKQKCEKIMILNILGGNLTYEALYRKVTEQNESQGRTETMVRA